MGFGFKRLVKNIGGAVKNVVVDAPKAVVKDIYSGTKKTVGAIGRGTEEVFEGIGAIGAAGVDVVQENPLLVAGVATGNPLLAGVGAIKATQGTGLFVDPVTGMAFPTPTTGQGGTVPYVPYTNYIQETPETRTVIVPQSQTSAGFNPVWLLYGGLAIGGLFLLRNFRK